MFIMQGVNLHGLDLNLLRLLDALLTERHLTRAAKRVGLSQPAMSHGLARLRKHLGDPLFVRARHGLEPTERATRIAGPLREALASIERCLADDTFDPATARRSFSLATADYGAFILLPPLLARVTPIAPGVDLWARTIADDWMAQLAQGDVDATLTVLDPKAVGASIHTRLLYEERFVCVVRQGHPRVKKRLDLDTWASLPHAFVSLRGTPGGVVDDVLAKHGKTRGGVARGRGLREDAPAAGGGGAGRAAGLSPAPRVARAAPPRPGAAVVPRAAGGDGEGRLVHTGNAATSSSGSG